MAIDGIGNSILLTRTNTSPTPSTNDNKDTPTGNSNGIQSQTTDESSAAVLPTTPVDGTTQEGNSEGSANFNFSTNSEVGSTKIENSQKQINVTI